MRENGPNLQWEIRTIMGGFFLTCGKLCDKKVTVLKRSCLERVVFDGYKTVLGYVFLLKIVLWRRII